VYALEPGTLDYLDIIERPSVEMALFYDSKLIIYSCEFYHWDWIFILLYTQSTLAVLTVASDIYGFNM
jgi:hypothetical protein